MKRNNLHVGLMAFAMLLVGASCSDDDNTLSYSTGAVQNTELKTILVQRGYTFNEDGNLLLDDLANNTTTLDLSGTQISTDALAELSMFPNLTDVDLSDNGYGPAFDFAKLPEQITGIDLTGNEIYDYDNLVSVVVEENGDETVTNLHEITKLYLPETAKENIEDLVRFYRQNKEVIASGSIDMKMEDEKGNLQTYTTLRDVPDGALRAYLQDMFPKMFDGEKIDISKHFSLSEKTVGIYLYEQKDIANLEGVQYIVNHPEWESGTCVLTVNSDKLADSELPLLKINKYVTNFQVGNNVRATHGIDFSQAEGLIHVYIAEVKGIESIDISASKTFAQRGTLDEAYMATGSTLDVYECPELKSIILPKAELKAARVFIAGLPSLETFDLTKFVMISTLELAELPTDYNLVYPNLTVFNNEWDEEKFAFTCTPEIYDLQATKDFFQKYTNQMEYNSSFTYGDYEAYNPHL